MSLFVGSEVWTLVPCFVQKDVLFMKIGKGNSAEFEFIPLKFLNSADPTTACFLPKNSAITFFR